MIADLQDGEVVVAEKIDRVSRPNLLKVDRLAYPSYKRKNAAKQVIDITLIIAWMRRMCHLRRRTR
jgi:DNA invertase Pin-like site-specific DNA recombinase